MKTEIVHPERVTKLGEGDLAPKPPDDRTTQVMQLYFERHGDQPTSFDWRCSHVTPPADEDPWQRRITVGPEWTALDFGWLTDNPGMVVIENQAGAGRLVQPTPAEREATKLQVIEVSFNGDDAPACLIHPGLFFAFMPVAAAGVRVRCRAGSVKAYLVTLPGQAPV